MPAPVEADEIYTALVNELTRNAIPNIAMGIILTGLGLYVAHALGDAVLVAATLTGGLAILAKLALIVRHMLRLRRGPLARGEARRWERGHLLTTAVLASSVGTLTGRIFAQPEIEMQMLATGLLFGYCAGVVTHLSIRPHLAIGALFLAALPATGAAIWFGGMPHCLLAGMFSLFLAAALQSVLSAHRSAIRQIQLRLDMATLARSDALTGLANRLGLRRMFESLPAGDGPIIAVHCFDLDGFKPVNDRYGHAAGDALLQELGARLGRLVVAPGVAARVGGDEFVVLQPSVWHPREVETLACRIVHALGLPYQLAGQTVSVGLSLGYACAPSASADLDDLIRRADAASYDVKRRGGGVAAGANGTGAPQAVAEVA